MLTKLRALLAVVLLASVPQSVIGQSMDRPLDEPASISTEFLTWIGKDVPWLEGLLAEQGLASEVNFGKGLLQARTAAAAKAANRIRAFAYMAAPGLRPPYYDLTVAAPMGRRFAA